MINMITRNQARVFQILLRCTVKRNPVWISQKGLSGLFKISRQTINKILHALQAKNAIKILKVSGEEQGSGNFNQYLVDIKLKVVQKRMQKTKTYKNGTTYVSRRMLYFLEREAGK
jgi:predicted sulfurtransferase